MITTEEVFAVLTSHKCREAVENNLWRDHVAVAMDKNVPLASLVATQVKYLQRARTKLPSYFEARCIIPSLAFEQSSSEECALSKEYSGKLCVDLTCGLGVDAFMMSRRFEKVITVEKDPLIAEIARYNFELLGVKNAEVICADSAEWIRQYKEHADLIYVDPDRRAGSNRKMYLLEDCLPNVIELMPALRAVAPKVVIKCSPIFDTERALALFGDHVIVEAVSLRGECKEVVIEIDDSIEKPLFRARAIGFGSFTTEAGQKIKPDAVPLDNYEYLIVPDVALQKSRLAVEYFSAQGMYIESDNGYAFCNTLPDMIFGRAYRILQMREYAPKQIKKKLAERGISRIEIMHRRFPYDTGAIAKSLGVKEGGLDRWAFTTHGGKVVAVELSDQEI